MHLEMPQVVVIQMVVEQDKVGRVVLTEVTNQVDRQ